MTRVLPWAAAWTAPSAALAWILLATGQNPVTGLAYGWLGVAGAAGYVVANAAVAWRRRRQFDEDLAAAWLSTPRENIVPLDDDIAITHEGLARLHLDIDRDAERRRHGE